jgi:biotin transport system ATP-binding protein
LIEFRGVAVSVPVLRAGRLAESKTLLAGVDLRLGERRVAVVGANGSGKSTLLRLVNGLVEPTSGSVVVNGLDSVADGRKVRSEVGFIFTDPLSQLLMGTARDDVELSLRGIVPDKAERRRQATELLAARGLDGVADQSVYDLSGGERQLVALTSVLACRPQVVVADEPTTLLDLRNRNLVAEALWGLEQQVLVATHDLELAARADRVLVVDAGRVVADAAADEAVEHYRRMMS